MTNDRSRACVVAWNIVAMFGIWAAGVAQQVQAIESPVLRTVALTHAAFAPGTEETFELLRPPVLNDAGRTAFLGYVGAHASGDPNAIFRSGVWSEGKGVLELLARSGDAAPGTEQTIEYFSEPALNAVGDAVFLSRLSKVPGTFYDGSAVYRTAAAGIEPLAVLGRQSADNLAGQRYNWLWGPQINDAGRVTFMGSFGEGLSGGISAHWVGEPEDLRMIVRQHASGYGLPENYSIADLGPLDQYVDAVSFNNSGQVAFEARLSRPGLPPWVFERSIWLDDNADLRPIARQGELAPGSDRAFDRIGRPALNDAKQVVFSATLTISDPDVYVGDGGLWVFEEGALKSLLSVNVAAPGMPGVTLASIGAPLINRQGEVMFSSYLQGDDVTPDNNSSLWRLKEGALELVARTGDAIPGTASRYEDLSDFAINGAGQIAFMSSHRVFGDFRDQLFVQNPDGSLVEIVSTGSMLEVAPGDLRLVTQVSFLGGSGLEDGRRVGFNERGQVAFRAEFADGSTGLFVSSLAAIPEPAGGTMLMAAMVGMLTFRRRLGGTGEAKVGWN